MVEKSRDTCEDGQQKKNTKVKGLRLYMETNQTRDHTHTKERTKERASTGLAPKGSHLQRPGVDPLLPDEKVARNREAGGEAKVDRYPLDQIGTETKRGKIH